MGFIETHKIKEIYSKEYDITFIMEEISTDTNKLLSEEVVGWYYGKPTDDNTRDFIGSLYKDYRGK